MSEPIWKDYTVTLGSADAYDFEIRLDNAAGQLIFSGRAYKRPGASNVEADVTAALLSMGFSPQEVTLALEGHEEAGATTTEKAVAYALRRLGGGL